MARKKQGARFAVRRNPDLWKKMAGLFLPIVGGARGMGILPTFEDSYESRAGRPCHEGRSGATGNRETPQPRKPCSFQPSSFQRFSV
jgi:hypothetical protein